MQKNDTIEIIGALDDLLDDERAALLEGNMDQVGRLLEHKERLVEELSHPQNAELEDLQRLSSKLTRNQALLNQALEGIRTVARRLASLRRVRSALDTYDARGTRLTIDTSSATSVEKRA
jgi:ABC-type transporter Mla subunit MlaD